MSLIFAAIVGLFLSFLPTMMVCYYKANTAACVITVILNILGFFTFGLFWLIAFIVAACNIKFVETLKSIGFAIMLIVIALIAGVTEIAFIASIFA